MLLLIRSIPGDGHKWLTVADQRYSAPTLPSSSSRPARSELRLLHRWLDTWTGVGLLTVGVERQGYRLSLTHVAEGEGRAQFSAHPLRAPAGYGVATTPWQAVQRAAWAVQGLTPRRSSSGQLSGRA